MRRSIQIRLATLLTSLLIGLAIHSTATGQTVDSAGTSRATRAATGSCEDQLKIALERLDKTLDAYEKAIATITAGDQQIAAMKSLDDLKNELLKAKDQMIADVLADNAFLRKANQPTVKSKVRKFLETVEKILLVGAGIYLGRL